MRQTGSGMPKPIDSTTITPLTLRIVSRDAGVTTIESKIGAVKLELPADSPLAGMKEQIEKSASNVTHTVRVDEGGSILNSKIDAQGPGADFVRQIANGMTKGLQGISYPKHPLQAGEAWSDTLDLGKMLTTAMAGMDMQAEGKVALGFRLLSVTDGLARVVFTMNGRAVGHDAAKTRSLSMDTNAVGESTVDLATGLSRTSKTTGDNVLTTGGKTLHQHMVVTLEPESTDAAASR